jgi:Transcription factor WhiB
MLTSIDTEMKWQDLASCNGIENPDIFFDDYESDEVTAINTDQMCFHCPVAKQCLEDGQINGSWGVHGGVYLVYGRIDGQRNSHKTAEDWKELAQIHGLDFDEGNS